MKNNPPTNEEELRNWLRTAFNLKRRELDVFWSDFMETRAPVEGLWQEPPMCPLAYYLRAARANDGELRKQLEFLQFEAGKYIANMRLSGSRRRTGPLLAEADKERVGTAHDWRTWYQDRVKRDPDTVEKIEDEIELIPTEIEKRTTEAVSFFVEAIAGRWAKVTRKDILGAPDSLIPEDKLTTFLQSPAIALFSIADFVRWDISPVNHWSKLDLVEQTSPTRYKISVEIGRGTDEPAVIHEEIERDVLTTIPSSGGDPVASIEYLYTAATGRKLPDAEWRPGTQVRLEGFEAAWAVPDLLVFGGWSRGWTVEYTYPNTILNELEQAARAAKALWDIPRYLAYGWLCTGKWPGMVPITFECQDFLMASQVVNGVELPDTMIGNIVLQVVPWCSPQTVKRAYEAIYNEWRGPKRSISAVDLELVNFVNEKLKSLPPPTRKTEAEQQMRGVMKSWAALQRKRHPVGKGVKEPSYWSRLGAFQEKYSRIVERIIGHNLGSAPVDDDEGTEDQPGGEKNKEQING